MKILFLASEVVPYSKTGGLADVAGALPAALARLGHEVWIATPLYGGVPKELYGLRSLEASLTLRFPYGVERARLWMHEPGPGVKVLFVENDRHFARPGLYGDAQGDYADNAERFGFFSVASLSGALQLGFSPDVVHLNDWQTGLAAVALRRGYKGTALERARVVFTIHNLAYQGLFPKRVMQALGLPWDLFTPEGIEFYDQVSFMKAGLAYADVLTTVSPTYAKEILTPEAGWGLDGFLRARQDRLVGILNGVDVETWNPATDRYLPANYSAEAPAGKARCREALLQTFGLSDDPRAPVYGIVSRFASQKGFDILLPALPAFLSRDVRLVVLGSGDPGVEVAFRELVAGFPGKVGLRVGYDEGLSHLIEAGSDFFLMPSRYEPCGLNQMYSLLYGTVPIVRAVGGLNDTVVDLSAPEGTGIKFGPYTVAALEGALGRSLALYGDRDALSQVRLRGMRQDFSWDRSARAYAGLYEFPRVRKAK